MFSTTTAAATATATAAHRIPRARVGAFVDDDVVDRGRAGGRAGGAVDRGGDGHLYETLMRHA